MNFNNCIIAFALTSITYAQSTVNEKEHKIDNSNVNLYVGAGTFGLVTHLFTNIEGRIVSSKYNNRHLYFRGSYGHVIAFSGGSGTSSFHTETETVVCALTFLKGKRKHHFETSSGFFIRDDSVFPLLELGYRAQEIQGGFLFQAKIGFLGIGLGLGYAF
tara:strand:- start:12 stop:491 length:480 start_codon:yes stop_codon:yes gene_type:complete